VEVRVLFWAPYARKKPSQDGFFLPDLGQVDTRAETKFAEGLAIPGKQQYPIVPFDFTNLMLEHFFVHSSFVKDHR